MDVFFKVGQHYGTLPEGLFMTGIPIPQFAPTGNFLYVLEAKNEHQINYFCWDAKWSIRKEYLTVLDFTIVLSFPIGFSIDLLNDSQFKMFLI
jgi:hypothetical protein